MHLLTICQLLAIRVATWPKLTGAVHRGRAFGGLGEHRIQAVGVRLPRERRAQDRRELRIQGSVAGVVMGSR